MRVVVTGTPGTGKTTATDHLDIDDPVIHLNDVIQREGLRERRDEERDTDVVDMDATADWLAENVPEDAVIESHVAHYFEADRAVVLRCHPEELRRRLAERGEPDATVAENAESEALDIVLSEAVDRFGAEHVYEIDTTDRSPTGIAAEIEAVVRGEREPTVGIVSYIDYLDR